MLECKPGLIVMLNVKKLTFSKRRVPDIIPEKANNSDIDFLQSLFLKILLCYWRNFIDGNAFQFVKQRLLQKKIGNENVVDFQNDEGRTFIEI